MHMVLTMVLAAATPMALATANAPPNAPPNAPTIAPPHAPQEPATPPANAPSPAPTAGPACGLEAHTNWALRAIACMRLEGSPDPVATSMLRTLSRDPDPRVRAFAVTARALRKDPTTADVILGDPDRRVLRAALRTGLTVDPEELAPIITPLLRPEDRDACLLGVELAACVDDARLRHRAIDSLGRVVMRLDRGGAGASAARLEALLDATGGHRPSDWQRFWQDTNPRTRAIACPTLSTEHAIARAGDAEFASFALALREAVEKPIDVAFCIDSSASMFADLPRAQALADAIGRSLADAVSGSRVAVVGYRDRKSEFITRTFPFTAAADLSAAALPTSIGMDAPGASRRAAPAAPIAWRTALWSFAADKGGSAPEAVLDGLAATFNELAWDPARRNFVVLIGDGPPHSGTRGFCADAAREARRRLGITTFVVSALPEHSTEDVQGFVEIADAGGGQHLRIRAADDLPSLILGPEFGDDHRLLMSAFRNRCDALIR